MNKQQLNALVDQTWDQSILHELIEYIKIPNKSPLFDSQWAEHGFMEQVVQQFASWSKTRNIQGLKLDIVRLENRTPLIFIEIPGDSDHTVLLYGHLDKQPEMSGWNPGLGPWTPVVDGDKLYGRGGADDGYALFASLTAIAALQDQNIPHSRCVVIIEACEESGSFDLPVYIDALSDRIGQPDLVICLDSGCGNYDQLWCTTSLRGLAGGDLSIQIIDEGVHSGDASGIVPDTFRILRILLDRIEDTQTGALQHQQFNARIPEDRTQQARLAAEVIGKNVYHRFPFSDSGQPTTSDLTELILNRTWRSSLTIVGANGLPEIENAGNVLRPATSVKLSLRLPPTCDASKAAKTLKQILETDPPYQAKVNFKSDWSATGWNAPAFDSWLEQSINAASLDYFGKPSVHMGEGGSIPFMGMLGDKFPDAQFMITGVLGPGSNAHGPNEFLHIPTAKKLTCCVANVIADHHKQFNN
ncbi:MAG: M20 family metallopeptidase [Gammaproteobacteria bacterium]|nr:M20 family metallopeptidase [Gammaproteobacteria bacterium]